MSEQEKGASAPGSREGKSKLVEPHWFEDDCLTIRCTCGCCLVRVLEWYGDENEPPVNWNIEFSERPHGTTLRQRIKHAVGAFRNRWSGCGAVVWDYEQMVEIHQWLGERIKANEPRGDSLPNPEPTP